MLGHLVAGEVFLAVGLQLVDADAALARHHEELHRLAGLVVGHADGRAAGHLGMRHDHVLDLVRVDVEAGHDDQVLLAVDDAYIAIRVDHRDIAGLQPALGIQHLGRGIGALPVALHHLRALDAQLAGLAEAQIVAGLVDHLAQGRGHRNPDGPRLVVLARIDRHHRTGFGKAVPLADGAAGDLLPALGTRLLQGHAARDGQLQPGEVQAAECLAVAQGYEQGVETDEAVELPLGHLADHCRQVARVGDQHIVVAHQHHRHAVKGEGIDVVQRQRGDQHLATLVEVVGHQRLALQHVGDQVAVGEHGPLGHPGGAAGVLQHRHIAGLRLGLAQRPATATLQHLGELHRLWQVVGRYQLLHVTHHAVDQQAPQRRQQVADLGDDHPAHAGMR
ncbi:hypothetical protein D9M71_294170 [compost metagenome]